MTTLTFNIPENLKQELKEQAAKEGISLSALIKKVMYDYLMSRKGGVK